MPAHADIRDYTNRPNQRRRHDRAGCVHGEAAPPESPAEVGELLDSGEARRSLKALALAHAEGKRWLVVGLGAREELTAERARVAAAVAGERAREIATRALCWELPAGELPAGPAEGTADGAPAIAAALVEGTILGDYRFERHRSAPDDEGSLEDAPTKHLERLIVSGPDGVVSAVADAALLGEAVNRARDLQNRPGNDLTPTALAEYAQRAGERGGGTVGVGGGARGAAGTRHGRIRGGRPGLRAGARADHARYDGPDGAHRPPRRSASWARR